MKKQQKIKFIALCLLGGVSFFVFNSKPEKQIVKTNDLENEVLKDQILVKGSTQTYQSHKREPAKSKIDHNEVKNQLVKKMRSANPKGFKYAQISNKSAPLIKNPYGKTYRIVDDYVAIRATAKNKEQYKGATYKLGHFIVPKEMASNESLFVVENTETGHLGILTGVITMKVKDLSELNYLLNHSNYEVKNIYEHINVAHFAFFDLDILLQSFETLSTHNQVIRAKIEVLEFERVAN